MFLRMFCRVRVCAVEHGISHGATLLSDTGFEVLPKFLELSGIGIEGLQDLQKPVGYGMEDEQKSTPVTEYFYKDSRTPGKCKHSVQIIQTCRVPHGRVTGRTELSSEGMGGIHNPHDCRIHVT